MSNKKQPNRTKLAMLTVAVFLGLLINISPSTAQTIQDLSITKKWIRATPPAAKVASGYMVIFNSGSNDETLTAVDFIGAEKTEIHEMKMDDGIMRMRPLIDGVKIPAGKTITLKTGGIHLMFKGLKAQLVQGQKLPIKLTFANAGEITVEFVVLSMGEGKKLMKKNE